MSRLDLLVKDLKIVSLKVQEEKVGGFTYSVTGPTIVVTPSYPETSFSFDWGTLGVGNPEYPDSNTGGGSGSGSSNTSGGEPTSSVKDPGKILDTTKSYLKTNIDTINKLIQSGKAPAGANSLLKTLEEAQSTIEKMENSSQKFRVDALKNNGDNRTDAEVTYDNKTGEIVISIEEGPVNDISLVVHELTHINQLMNGELWIEKGEIKGYDINDEVEAYQKQHIIKYGAYAGSVDLQGNSYPAGNYKVTAEDVRKFAPGHYDNLPNQNMTKPSGGETSGGGTIGGGAIGGGPSASISAMPSHSSI